MYFRLPIIVRLLADYAGSSDGASAGEYALMLTVLGGCAIIILHSLGHSMNQIFGTVATAFNIR
jgi:Flp pilus assembly pilin Flp